MNESINGKRRFEIIIQYRRIFLAQISINALKDI
jgi:hypothetical protein